MLSSYPACFYKEENGYSVIFPDFNHLATCGDTLDDAYLMAIDCLAGYLHSLKIDGEDIPSPSPYESISLKDAVKDIDPYVYSDSFKTIITVDVDEYSAAYFEKGLSQIVVSLPSKLYDTAIFSDLDLSQILQDAVLTICAKNNLIQEKKTDEIDKQMLSEITSDPDCHEFVSQLDAMKEIGL